MSGAFDVVERAARRCGRITAESRVWSGGVAVVAPDGEPSPSVRRLFPFIERIFADSGYQGPRADTALRALGPWQFEIVKRSDQVTGFEDLPKRWVVERTFAWLGRCRRLARDYENLNRFAVAYILLAMIRLMLRRLTRPNLCPQKLNFSDGL